MAKRTVVTMLLAGPEGAKYGVFRAYVRNPTRRWTWNVNNATYVATVVVPAGDTRPSYRAMAEQHATEDWPALEYPEEGIGKRFTEGKDYQ